MEEKLLLNELYDIYKCMLTEKMQEVFILYYNEDLSLREIAQTKNITYQAVRDSLKKTTNELYSLEKKLHVYELKQELNNKNVEIEKMKNRR